MRHYIFILLLFSCVPGWAQDFTWWDVKHNWDGITERTDKIIMAPAFMGPNALPVPIIQNGLISDRFTLEASIDGHFSDGDNTVGMHTALFTPLFSDRVGLHFNWVPIEYFRMDTITRDIRRSTDRDGRGTNMTDLFIATQIQLLKDHQHLPDILVTINLKTATGNKLSSARTTDAPGYFFDASFGKELSLNHAFFQAIRPHLMLGLYVWQVTHPKYEQNDAFSFGVGYDLKLPKAEFKNAIGGYVGYIGNGDDPIVLRASLKSKFDSAFNLQLRFQQGLHDFAYTSFRAGIILNL